MESFDQELLEAIMPQESMFPAKISLAMSYVPNQPFEHLNDEHTAFSKGTLFKALEFPFIGGKRR